MMVFRTFGEGTRECVFLRFQSIIDFLSPPSSFPLNNQPSLIQKVLGGASAPYSPLVPARFSLSQCFPSLRYGRITDPRMSLLSLLLSPLPSHIYHFFFPSLKYVFDQTTVKESKQTRRQ